MHAQLHSALQPHGDPEARGLAESDIQEIERELAQLRVQRLRIDSMSFGSWKISRETFRGRSLESTTPRTKRK